jgi:hypothetical protein
VLDLVLQAVHLLVDEGDYLIPDLGLEINGLLALLELLVRLLLSYSLLILLVNLKQERLGVFRLTLAQDHCCILRVNLLRWVNLEEALVMVHIGRSQQVLIVFFGMLMMVLLVVSRRAWRVLKH